MTTDARLRICLATGEFEVAGPESFVAQYDQAARDLLGKLSSPALGTFQSAPPADSGNGASSARPTPTPVAGTEDWGEFGEVVHLLPKGTSGTDQILVAGFYASLHRSDGTFATGEASKLLIEQGIKLANPSQSMKNNLTAKRVFKVGSRYKLSREGNDRVNVLLGRSPRARS